MSIETLGTMARGLAFVICGGSLVACAHGGALHSGNSSAAASLCAGISQADRQQSLLSSDRVIAVKEMRRRRGKQMIQRTVGVDVVVAAARCDSAAWLERVVRCQISQGALVASSAPALRAANVTVFRAGPNYVVRITSERRSEARSVAQSARAHWRTHQ